MPQQCANPLCSDLIAGRRTLYCSDRCSEVVREYAKSKIAGESAAIRLGFLSACRIFYFECGHCGVLLVKHYKRAGPWGPICAECKRRWYQAHDARKNDARRTAGPKIMSVHELASRDGAKCHLCHRKIDMGLSGMRKWGPTIDHLVPVSKGGDSRPGNLALAHRHCNIARGNRGDVQMLLAV